MEKLQMWCKGFSVVTIISGVMLSLIPSSKLLSSFKTLVALILTVMFISPLTGLTGKDVVSSFFISDRINENETAALSNNLLYSCAQDVIEDKIQEVFSAENINTRCDVVISEKDDSTMIERIIITGEFDNITKKYIAQKINELFQSQMNIEFSG